MYIWWVTNAHSIGLKDSGKWKSWQFVSEYEDAVILNGAEHVSTYHVPEILQSERIKNAFEDCNICRNHQRNVNIDSLKPSDHSPSETYIPIMETRLNYFKHQQIVIAYN